MRYESLASASSRVAAVSSRRVSETSHAAPVRAALARNEGERIIFLILAVLEAADETRSSSVLIIQSVVAADLMHLGRRRWREADENYDAITTWIHADSVDVEIGFPVVNGPNVAGLIYVDIGATHGRDKAWRHWWWTVQRHAIMQ